MDEELKQLEVSLSSYYETVERLGSNFDSELALTFLETYEEFEITTDNFPTPEQYTDLMILYFVTDNWHTPAKMLWKRIPAAMKKDKSLIGIWEIGKLLFTSKYAEAAVKINEFKSSKLAIWLKAGYKYIIHKLVIQAYENIDDATYQTLLGLKTKKEQTEYMEYFDKEVKPRGKIPFRSKHIEPADKSESYEISEVHLQNLKTLAQFIERESATQIDKEG